ncbi:hypothetical protein [Paenibacillus macquariensis]|uniref:hypothetical protein n=1 Tax=Paenibacillus macquariensis TaxID=948756 RepID=UPI0007C3E09A|nr:hypothetical protein [Paenibacillus macquariensis]MEC0093568.1 hypothetical protein [Paenibacillus macquariensis]OAB29827.1 hypothetical protein PMSM_23055 [Paenibacillus macquariensis subsp. macquariensis]
MFIDLLDKLNKANEVPLYLDTHMKPGASSMHINQVQAMFGKAVTQEDFIKKKDAKAEIP